jgi:hypothetical protein
LPETACQQPWGASEGFALNGWNGNRCGTFTDLGGLSNLCRSLFTSRYSRGFGHAGLRHFFRDAGKECFVRFFFGFRSCHTRHDVIKPEAIMFTLEQGS